MNTQNNSPAASFQNRKLRAASFRTRPVRFSTEQEGEGVELFLRGLMLLSLVVALAICNVYLTARHGQPSVLPTHDTAVACTQTAAAPAAEAL